MRTKVLIVSLSAGSGHLQTARALEKAALLEFPELECRHIDIADYITPLLKKATVEGYDFLAAHMPKVWSGIFRLTDNQTFAKTYQALTGYLKMLNSFDFLREVEKFKPDHIITTHFLPSEILVHAMKKQGISIPITQIITDYGVHPMMIINGVTNYVVSTPHMKEELIHTYHIPPAHIYDFGIPIDPAFYHIPPLDPTRSKYHIPHDKPLILLLSGGSGLIELSDIIEELFAHIHTPITIVSVAGKNKKLLARISKLIPPAHITYRPIGWTDHIPQLMKLSSVVISKPGGLTTTECMATGVPLIAIHPIPGQEEFNIAYVKKNHLGDFAQTATDIPPLVDNYFSKKSAYKKQTVVQSGRQLLTCIIQSKINH